LALRDDKGRILPGKSLNPGGRKAVDHKVTELARQHTDDAIRVLAEIALDPKAPKPSRIAAASRLLDQGWGRPPQSVAISHSDEIPEAIQVLWRTPEADE
jgi:hypothetical protein